MKSKNSFSIKDIINFLDNNDISFIENEFEIKKNPHNIDKLDELLNKLSKACLSQESDFIYLIPYFIEKNILNFNNDYQKNIKIILEKLLIENSEEAFYYLFKQEKYNKYFYYFKEFNSYIEKIINISISLCKNDLFYFYYSDELLFPYNVSDFINLCIINENQDIFKFLIEKDDLYHSQYSIINNCLRSNSDVFFIKYFINIFEKKGQTLSKSEIYNYISKSIDNYKVFRYLFEKIEDEVNDIRLCNLLENSIKRFNFDIVKYLIKKVDFNISKYDFDFISTFFDSYEHNIPGKMHFDAGSINYINDEIKIKMFKIIISNKYIVSIEEKNEIELIINMCLKKFDFCLLRYLLEDLQLKIEINNPISEIRLQESFFNGAISEDKTLINMDNIQYAVEKLNIDLYYRDNLYIYKMIFKKAPFLNSIAINIFDSSESLSDIQKFVSYLLDNEDISKNFDLKILEKYNDKLNPEVYSFIINKFKFKNF